MSSAKQMLRKSIDQLTEQQAVQALELVRGIMTAPPDAQPPVLAGFEVILPAPDAPPFEDFEPVAVSGKPISEILIADRR